MPIMTAAEARGYLPQLTGTTEDTNLEAFIARFDAVAAGWAGFPAASAGAAATFLSATYTQFLRGPGGRSLHLPVFPVISVTTIHDDPELEYGSDTLVASTDYDVDEEEGAVTLLGTAVHGAWSKAARAIKAVYVAGYATAPGGLKHACGVQVAAWWRGRSSLGLANVSEAGKSAGLKPLTLLAEVKEALGEYRLLDLGIA